MNGIDNQATEQIGMPANSNYSIDFSDTERAFQHRSNASLRATGRLFALMNRAWMVNILSRLGLLAVRWRLPFATWAIRKTIFPQFVGGTTLLDSLPAVDTAWQEGVFTILDYGAEAKASEEDFNHSMNQCIRGIEFAKDHPAVLSVTTKVTALGRFELLQRMQAGENLTRTDRAEYKNLLKRLDAICYSAEQRNLTVYIDAEESWIQDTIDHLVTVMMRRYNRKRVVVYNTFQMYRSDRLQFLIDSYNRARRQGYLLGAKLVRGAYMDKERARATELGYPSPIQVNKAATDDAFNTAVRFCLDHYEYLAICNASHNEASARLQAELIKQRGLPLQHPHLLFSQLYGMSDNLTYILAQQGFRVAKYTPYGPVREVVPYLIRRAQENSTVTGDLSREYQLVRQELKRRRL